MESDVQRICARAESLAAASGTLGEAAQLRLRSQVAWLASALGDLPAATAARYKDRVHALERALVEKRAKPREPSVAPIADKPNAPITDALRQRAGPRKLPKAGKEEDVQEALSSDMAELARALKDNSLRTNALLAADVQTLTGVTRKADDNLRGLDTASAQLRAQIAASGGCWLWLLLLFVIVSFIMMVLLIRITN